MPCLITADHVHGLCSSNLVLVLIRPDDKRLRSSHYFNVSRSKGVDHRARRFMTCTVLDHSNTATTGSNPAPGIAIRLEFF